MAKFSETEWLRILSRLEAAPTRYGWPERRAGSIVMASFNIRKLGNPNGKSKGAFDFLARFIAQCDLVAVQEVLEDLSALEKVRTAASQHAGSEFHIIASDITGGLGATGSTVERLAFLYRPDRVRRSAVAADISFDRSWIFRTMYDNRFVFRDAVASYSAELADYDRKFAAKVAAATADGRKRPSRRPPPFVSPQFVDFIRTPHLCSFEIPGPGKPYQLTAINAHLLYGDKSKQAIERRREFEALIEWLLIRAAKKKSYNQDFILMGDLNLAFDDPDAQRPEIVQTIKGFNARLKRSRAATVVNFPFIDPRLNPRTGNVEQIRTNARLTETFDQIGLFAHDKRLPGFDANQTVHDRTDPDAYDYQAFDFVDLFAEAVKGKDYAAMTKAERSTFVRRFQHDVSDHMPIWIRLPLPS